MKEKPKASTTDAVHTIVKAGLSAVPVIGGPAAEIFSAIIVPPLSKRRDEWIESIAKGLIELERKVDDFRIEKLSTNEVFITVTMQASQIAIRNHQKEKLIILRNAVLNAALPNAPEEDTQMIFFNCVDAFTPRHLRLIKFFDNPERWMLENNITYPEWLTETSGHTLQDLLRYVFSDIEKPPYYGYLVGRILKDLSEYGLTGGESGIPTDMLRRGYRGFLTEMGKSFLSFISSPIDGE